MDDADAMPETTAAWRKLIFLLRAYICEMLMLWGLRIAPKDYIPSVVRMTADAAFRTKAD